MVSVTELVAGITTLVPMLLGYWMAASAFRSYLKKKNTIILFAAVLFAAVVSPWLGVSAQFILAILNQPSLSDPTYVMLYSWAVPVIAITWFYITAALFKKTPWFKFLMLGISLVLALIFFYTVYIQQMFEAETLPNSIYKDSHYTGLASILIYLYIAIIVFFVFSVNLWVSMKTTSPLVKVKSRFIAAGALLFVTSAATDGTMTLDVLWQVILVRTFLLLSIICLYFGFTTPEWFKKKYQE